MSRGRTHLIRIAAALTGVALLLMGMPLAAQAGGSLLGAKNKYVHLVLDDSGSMEDNNKWVSACYALQGLSAMLSRDDVLVLYRLNDPQTLKLTGLSGAERIDRISAFLPAGGDGGTPLTMVEQAAVDLKAVPDTYEKWLVVVADGVFDKYKNKQSKLLKTFQDFGPGDKTFRLAYMGIGSDVITVGPEDGDTVAGGIYPFYATDTNNYLSGNGIISKLNKIGNTIFSNYVLRNVCLDSSNGELTLNLEMPMEQLIVFAQGVNLMLGESLNSVSGSVAGTVTNPKYADLSGSIASFPAEENVRIPMGTYALPFKADNFDPSQVMVYARPAVDIGVDLFSDGVALIPGAADLAEGDYTYEAYLLDPQTGAHIANSEQTADIYNTLSTVITNNAKQETEGVSGSLHAERGDLNILSVALVPPSNARIEANQGHGISFKIVPEKPPTPKIILKQNGAVVQGDTIQLDSDPTTDDGTLAWSIVWEDTQTGKPASDSLIARTRFEVTISNGTASPQKTTDSQGTVTVRGGTLTLAVKASLDNGETSAASDTWTVANTGGIEAERVADWKLTQLETDPTYEINVSGQINGLPLTQTQWQAADLLIQDDGGLDWQWELGDQVSTWKLHPKYKNGDMLSTATGELSVKVSARLTENGSVSDFTSVRIPFTVLDLTQAERFQMLFDRYFIPVLITLIALVIGVGYLPFVKNYFPRMNPVVREAHGRDPTSNRCRLRLHWTSFLPYAAMSGTIDPNMPAESICPVLSLRAGKRHMFTIRNGEDFKDQNNLTINGERIREVPAKGIQAGNSSEIHMRSDSDYNADYLFTFNGQT